MRARIIWSVLAVVLGLVAWALMTPPSAPSRVGFNRLVENAVTTTPAGRTDWRPSVVGADVEFGDRIATADASRLEVNLLDRSLLTVGAHAQLEIDRFVYDPERDIAGVAVSILRGAFRFASDGRGGPPEPIGFRTPGAEIGIRGTVIEGVVGPAAVAFLAGIPGAPDLSAESNSAAVLILREGAMGVAVNGQSVVLDRPVQMVALTRTRLYPPFGATGETDRRFEALLPGRRVPSVPPVVPPPPADPAVAPPGPANPPRPPAAVPSDPPSTAAPPPVGQPEARPPLTRAPVLTVTRPPDRVSPATAATATPMTRSPPPQSAPPQAAPSQAAPSNAAPVPRRPATGLPTRADPVEPPVRRPAQPPTRAPQP
ncbi:MAG: FecR family protein [Caulobacteraceae bacterium]|nr:FecR family protein [Caulobacteraceae bacterium]